MIVKVKPYKRPAFAKLLNYMLDKKSKILNRKGECFVIIHNLRGEEIEDWVEQFKENEKHRQYNHKKKNYLTHEIISFHKEDVNNISLEKMEDMAREYIQLRNPNGMYVAVPHFDKDHYHIHICASALQYRSGKSMRMSKQDFQELKKGIQMYQQKKYPELTKSVVGHGKKGVNVSDKEYQMKLRTGKETEREKIVVILETCFSQATSEKDFRSKINEAGLKTYERGGKISGIIYGKHKFRLSRLGLGKERIKQINKVLHRNRELHTTRERSRKRNIHKYR